MPRFGHHGGMGFGPRGGIGGFGIHGGLGLCGPRLGGPPPLLCGPYYGGYRYRRLYGPACCNIF